jgi:hypothetical protein
MTFGLSVLMSVLRAGDKEVISLSGRQWAKFILPMAMEVPGPRI